jgi:hypothetical protein
MRATNSQDGLKFRPGRCDAILGFCFLPRGADYCDEYRETANRAEPAGLVDPAHGGLLWSAAGTSSELTLDPTPDNGSIDMDATTDLTTKFIKAAHAKGGRDLHSETTAADLTAMLKTDADRETERAATAYAERFLGDHLSLSDPYGDQLRKGDKRTPTALDTIKKIHARGARQMAKGAAYPPESSNGRSDDVHADTGADNNWDDETAPSKKPTLATPPHTASMRALQALRTQNDGGRDPDATIHAIQLAQRDPQPLVPGALRGFSQNPNRDDGR